MAEKKATKPGARAKKKLGPVEIEKTEMQRLVENVKENPLLYGAAVVFVILCLVAGILVRLNAAAHSRQEMTEYATALNNEDPALQTAELAKVAGQGGQWGEEALYMMGEAAIRAQEYDKAEQAFNQVREKYPNSEYAPRAVAGLAWLDENKGEFDKALAGYQEVQTKWGNTFTGRLQPFNIGRVYESLGKFKEAVDAYRSQIEVFPDSAIAAEAQAALDRLKQSHPDLFPEEPKVEDTAATAAPAETTPAPAPAETAPAPAETAPAPAPAETAPAPAETAPAPAPAETTAAPAAESPAK